MKRGPTPLPEEQNRADKKLKYDMLFVKPEQFEENKLLHAVINGELDAESDIHISSEALSKLYPCKTKIDATNVNKYSRLFQGKSNEEKRQELHLLSIAAIRGHDKTVAALFERDRDGVINEDIIFESLISAIINSHTKTALILIKKTGQINRKFHFPFTSQKGISLIELAVSTGNVEIVQALIKSGASINMCSRKYPLSGRTPLYIAASRGHTETVLVLLENNANIDHAVSEGSTPLIIAIGNRHIKTCRTLINAGADVNKQNNQGVTALHIAAAYGENEIIKRLICKRANVDLTTKNKDTPLHLAAQKGHAEAVLTLVNNGAKVNKKNSKGMTPLHTAVVNGHTEAVFTLINYDADINLRDNYGQTPLSVAISRNYYKIVDALLKKGAEVNVLRWDQLNEMQVAIIGGHTNAFYHLLKHGCSVDRLYSNSFTSFDMAVYNGETDIALALIENGADATSALEGAKGPGIQQIKGPRQTTQAIEMVPQLTKGILNHLKTHIQNALFSRISTINNAFDKSNPSSFIEQLSDAITSIPKNFINVFDKVLLSNNEHILRGRDLCNDYKKMLTDENGKPFSILFLPNDLVNIISEYYDSNIRNQKLFLTGFKLQRSIEVREFKSNAELPMLSARRMS